MTDTTTPSPIPPEAELSASLRAADQALAEQQQRGENWLCKKMDFFVLLSEQNFPLFSIVKLERG